MSIAAPRKSGKSFLISKMMQCGLFDHYDFVIILCPTLEFNDDYLEFLERKNVTGMSSFSGDDIAELFDRQASCMRKVKARERGETLTTEQIWVLLHSLCSFIVP